MSNNSDELKSKTVDFGIDLGTTTSIISHCEGNDTPIVPNLNSNRNFTPSAVAFDEDGMVSVGEPAKRLSLLDKDNAYAEFKLDMGMNKKYIFKDSGKELLPEELSAEVLKDLRNSVAKQLDKTIYSSVITVPADFGPIQIGATRKAAELAGFQFTPIIMEPVAAAYAYSNVLKENGTWLIYDLGGGTFDVSIVKREDEDFENLAHSGDEHLGGNLIDWDIVYKVFTKKVRDDLGISDFNKKNKEKYKKEFAKLKGAAEEAKKDVSSAGKAKIFVDSLMVHDNEIYDFKYSLSREELEEIMKPYIKRTIYHCNDAMKKAKLKADDIDYLILVGGSTLSPIIRESIGESFNIPLKYDLDPTTVVAKGAALFAGTIPDSVVYIEPGNFGLKLDYVATGPIDEEKRGTGKIPVEDDGYFEFELKPEDETNSYSVSLYDPDVNLVELDENSSNANKYKKAPMFKVILPHTLGLGLRGDVLFILAKEGSPLPYHNMAPFKTNADVIKGDETSFISMPLYNGTAKVASNNEKVGEFIISGKDVNETILKGTEVTVTVDIDESRVVKIEVNVLDIGQKFPCVIDPHRDTLDFAEVNNKFIKAKSRYNDIKLKCSNEDINEEIEAYLNQIEEENIIENIDNFMENAESDDGALNQANKLINKLNEILSNIDKFFEEKDLFENIEMLKKEVKEAVDENGTLEQKEEFSELSRQLDEAIENEDSVKINQIRDSLLSLKASCMSHNEAVEEIKKALLYLILMAEYRPEDEVIVNDLKQRGSEALNNEDVMEMANVAQKLMNLAIMGGTSPYLDDSDDNELDTL